MNKLHVSTAGMATDASFPSAQEAGKMVTCFLIPCTGTIDGTQSSFQIKVYGAGSDQKIKSGMTVNGELNARYNCYEVKKKDNPQLFSQGGGGGFGGGKFIEGRKFINFELEAVKLGVEIVKAASVQVVLSGEVSAEQLAEKAVAIARNTFVPYLRSTSERHDETAKVDETKRITGQAVRQIIQNNGMTEAIRASGKTMGDVLAVYEETGRDATKFISAIRQRFAANAPVPANTSADFDDDVPF